MNNTITEMKNTLEGINSRVTEEKERMNAKKLRQSKRPQGQH